MADFYVSSLGSDSADGSYDSPWLTVKHAHDTVSAGDHIWLADDGGVFREDWGSGYIMWNKADVSISSLFENNPSTLCGVSGSFSLRFGSGASGVSFSNLNITTGSASNTQLIGCSTSSDVTDIEFVGCNIVVVHDVGTSMYCVNAGGSGAHIANYGRLSTTLATKRRKKYELTG